MMFELVVLIHFVFIVWVAIGGLLAIRRWRLCLLHLPALLWGVLVEWNGWICPLTPIENELRAGRGMPVYHTGFIEHYLIPVIYPDGLTRDLQMALANGVAYGFTTHRHFLKRAENPTAWLTTKTRSTN
jgi:hypothetical protein